MATTTAPLHIGNTSSIHLHMDVHGFIAGGYVMTWIVVLLFMFGPPKSSVQGFLGGAGENSSSFYFPEPVGWMSLGIGSYVFSTKQCGAVRYFRIRQFSQIGIASDFEFWSAHSCCESYKNIGKGMRNLGESMKVWCYYVSIATVSLGASEISS